jgi:hypothetical protein
VLIGLLIAVSAWANGPMSFEEASVQLRQRIPVGRSHGVNTQGRPCVVEFHLSPPHYSQRGLEPARAIVSVWDASLSDDVHAPGAGLRRNLVTLEWLDTASQVLEAHDSLSVSSVWTLELRSLNHSGTVRDPSRIRIEEEPNGISVTLVRGAQSAWLAGLRLGAVAGSDSLVSLG